MELDNQSKKLIKLNKALMGGKPRDIEIDGVNYDIETENIGGDDIVTVRVPETAISDVELANAPQKVKFEIAPPSTQSMLTPEFQVVVLDAKEAHITIELLFDPDDPTYPVDATNMAKASLRYLVMAECGEIEQASYMDFGDALLVEALFHMSGKTFEEIIRPVREAISELEKRLHFLGEAVRTETCKV